MEKFKKGDRVIVSVGAKIHEGYDGSYGCRCVKGRMATAGKFGTIIEPQGLVVLDIPDCEHRVDVLIYWGDLEHLTVLDRLAAI